MGAPLLASDALGWLSVIALTGGVVTLGVGWAVLRWRARGAQEGARRGAWRGRRAWRVRRIGPRRCLACGYDKRGLAVRASCPECGASAPGQAVVREDGA